MIGQISWNGINKFIIVAINHYNKWIETRVINYKTKEAIIEFVRTQIVEKHGLPRRILSDIGKEFDNREVREFADRRNIVWEYAAKAQHKTAVCVERANQTV